MKFSVSDLRTDRQWRSITGLDKNRFYKLLEHFKETYVETYSMLLKDRLVDNDVEYCIKNEEDLFLFTLFSIKSGLINDTLGFVAGMDGSNAHRNQKTGIEILALTLRKLGHEPRRSFKNAEDFIEYFSRCNIDTLLIDATEQRIQRPSDNKVQKDYYSGKKKAHTLKSLVISSPDKQIRYLSNARIGKIHDYKFMKEVFPPDKNWFEIFNIRVDLGFLGIVSDYLSKSINIPHKKSKKSDLTEEQKLENKAMSSERIVVEHSIGGLKRYRILSDRLRIHLIDYYDEILGVCAGLWNFYLAN